MSRFNKMKKQTLRSENFQAAKNVATLLKRYKAITLKEFKEHWCASRGWTNPARWQKKHGEKPETAAEYYGLPYNYDSTLQFLRDHEIMTIKKMNGHTFLVATQKLSRGKQFERVFR